MTGLERLIKLLDEQYYGSVLAALLEVFAIITGCVFVRKDRIGKLFLAYLILDFLILASYFSIISIFNISPRKLSFFVNPVNIIISFVELFVYCHFFINVIQNKSIIKLIRILRFAFIGIIGLLISLEINFFTKRYYISEMVAACEFLLLLLPCFAYFYELLNSDPAQNIYQRPSFWIVTGIFVYSLISIPYCLIDGFVMDHGFEQRRLLDLALFYAPLGINFILLAKAFFCKKALST